MRHLPPPSAPTRRRTSRLTVGATALALTAAPFTCLPSASAAETPVPIAAIQGTGDRSPLVGQPVTTTPSVVTAVYGQTSTDFRGFVIQTPGTGGPKRKLTAASDAVFVYLGSKPFDVHLGDVVTVSGTASEYNGLTEIGGAVTVREETGRYPAVRPVTGLDWASTASHRENLESMLWQGSDSFTVANTYSLLRYGQLGLSAGGPLVQPTDAADAQDPAAIAAVERRNAVRAVDLDDGADHKDFTVSAGKPLAPVPYLRPGHPVTVGDRARLTEPVVVDWRNHGWVFNPTTPIGPGQEVARITHRTAPKPAVGGALQIASFNVLNYFTTVGQGRPGCTGGDQDTTGGFNVTNGCDVRGAWDAADLARQQAKIVAAINALGASVVGLMEIENSAKLGEPADEATATLVAALNRAAGYRRWDYVRSSSQLQDVADQDYISNALIYSRREVAPTGTAYAFGAGAAAGGAFDDARTPIAASFRPRSGGSPLLVVVNHFKSKSGSGATGDNADTKDGQGAFNGDRVRQAQALLGWLPSVQAASRTRATALLGDFNSYTREDPLQVLYAGGYRNAAPATQYSYSFDGLAGSLDHVLLNPAARKRLTGARVWNINAGQSPALEYSAYGTTAENYYRPDPLRSSDHDPVVAGLRRR